MTESAPSPSEPAPTPLTVTGRTMNRSGHTSFGTAYFGVRDLDHAAADLAAIRDAGHDWVLLPMTQDDAAWEQATFRMLVDAARAVGLEPVISPWGGNEFGGEGIAGPLSVVDWLARAAETGATILHIDEPKANTSSIAEVIAAWSGRVWLTIQPNRTKVLDGVDLSRVDVLGTDAYDGDVGERVTATSCAGSMLGRLDLAWVQAFRIPAGAEPAVGDAVRAMAGLAPRVGIWGWKGSAGRGDLRSDRPAVVNAAVAGAIAEVHEAESKRFEIPVKQRKLALGTLAPG
jgi:hypothetical protein